MAEANTEIPHSASEPKHAATVNNFMIVFTLVPSIEVIAQEEKEANKGIHAVEEPLLECSDVATQRGAQALFELSEEDRFDLDKDGDGVACETPDGRAVAEDGTKLGAEVGADLDCMDFPSQKAAQGRLRSAPTDPHGLDVDNNGIACEIKSAEYDDPAQDLEPVTEARSAADLDCEDFECQHEAQMVYFQDESDPNNLDEGVEGSGVCRELPILYSNVHFIYGEPADSSAGPGTQAMASQSQVVGLLSLTGVVLLLFGLSTLTAAVWIRRVR